MMELVDYGNSWGAEEKRGFCGTWWISRGLPINLLKFVTRIPALRFCLLH